MTEFARGYLRGVWKTVPLLLAAVLEENAFVRLVLAKEVWLVVLVAGCEQCPEMEHLIIVQKVLEEVAYAWVVAIAEDGSVLEMPLVMDKFFLDVGKLGIELVLLGRPSGVQASI